MTMLTLRVNLSVGLVAMVNTSKYTKGFVSCGFVSINYQPYILASLYSNITASNQCPLPDDTMNDQDEVSSRRCWANLYI